MSTTAEAWKVNLPTGRHLKFFNTEVVKVVAHAGDKDADVDAAFWPSSSLMRWRRATHRTEACCCLCTVLLHHSGSERGAHRWHFVWPPSLPAPERNERYCQECYIRLYGNGLKRLQFPEPDARGHWHLFVPSRRLPCSFPYLRKYWKVKEKDLDRFRKFNLALKGGFGIDGG